VESSHAQRMAALDRDGFAAIPGALGPEAVRRLTAVVDRTYDRRAASGRLAADGSLHMLGFVSRDPAFRQLVDLADPLALVAGVLGWNIYLYHCHIDQHPPVTDPLPPAWGWHQDGGRQNLETESEPTRPRLSVKLAYWLSDVSEPGRGNLMVVPGSHVRNRIPRPDRPELGFECPEGAIAVTARAGDAVLFDRRLWHSRSDNLSTVTRKALFMGYTYRWVRPRDAYPIDWEREPYRSLSPIRAQLLGWGSGAESFWALGEDAIPLREELRASGLLGSAGAGTAAAAGSRALVT
jgi:ectoine hydroxylase